MKTIDLGHCGTCGRKVDAVLDWTEFINPVGQDLAVVQVEGHCGVPGHAMKVTSVLREHYEELRDMSLDDDSYYEAMRR